MLVPTNKPMEEKMRASSSRLNSDKIKEAYQIAAELVSKFGDMHLVVFTRLHSEIEAIKERDKIKLFANTIAAEMSSS